MKSKKQKPDFLHIGNRLLLWYEQNSRDLPWRKTKDPYKIWICEVVLQQTQVKQGTAHYLRFVERFPDAKTLANADTDEVLLYWKGLGYYSRAMNLHKAAKQISEEFGGNFPDNFDDILKLKGVGKYTAAAVASICFGTPVPAVDGNFYRVLSRLFADDFDVSNTQAFAYFSKLAMRIMPADVAGDFNQAMMDLGSEICKPINPLCSECPLNKDCVAYLTGTTALFPVKTKKTKVNELAMQYYFVENAGRFLIRRRDTVSIWKNLYEFATEIPADWEKFVIKTKTIAHKLTHRNMLITISHTQISTSDFEDFAKENGFVISSVEESDHVSFPKPLENYIKMFNVKNPTL